MDFQNSPQPYNNYPPVPRKTNTKAIAALVLGILGIVVPYIGIIMGIIAIVFAKLSMDQIRMTGEEGRGMAIAGLVCGIVSTVLYGIILLLLLIVFLAASSSYY